MKKFFNSYCIFIVFFCSSNYNKVPDENKDFNYIYKKPLEQSDGSIKSEHSKNCNEIEGVWEMVKYLSPLGEEITNDNNMFLNIDSDCSYVFVKNSDTLEAAKLTAVFEDQYSPIYYVGEISEEKYIKYVPKFDMLVINLRGFDGGLEYYKRLEH